MGRVLLSQGQAPQRQRHGRPRPLDAGHGRCMQGGARPPHFAAALVAPLVRRHDLPGMLLRRRQADGCLATGAGRLSGPCEPARGGVAPCRALCRALATESQAPTPVLQTFVHALLEEKSIVLRHVMSIAGVTAGVGGMGRGKTWDGVAGFQQAHGHGFQKKASRNDGVAGQAGSKLWHGGRAAKRGRDAYKDVFG